MRSKGSGRIDKRVAKYMLFLFAFISFALLVSGIALLTVNPDKESETYKHGVNCMIFFAGFAFLFICVYIIPRK